jgi:hypothetical protein
MRLTPVTVEVINGSYAVGGNGAAANDFDITDTLAKFNWVGPVTLQLVGTVTGGASTYDLNINVSMDGGTTYTLLKGLQLGGSTTKTFTQLATTGSEVIVISPPAATALYKTDQNLGSGTTYTVELYASGLIQGPALMDV